MAFIPWENIEYKTNSTMEEIINRINSIIEPKGMFWIFFLKKYSYGKPYQGEINENKFKIRRIIIYANAFLPFIEGKIIENNGKRLIKIKMRCNYFVIGFMTIWFGGILILLLNNIIKTDSIIEIISYVIGSLIFIILGYLIITIPFKIESKKSKKILNELFIEENSKI